MNLKAKIAVLMLLVFGWIASSAFQTDDQFISYTINPQKQDLKMYWKNDQKQPFKSIQNLKVWLGQRNKKLLFAMNGGMYQKDNSPQGLYIENGKAFVSLDTMGGNGNFYLKPNGVFYLNNQNLPGICISEKFNGKGVKYATQSGPMLVIDGKIHPAFKQGSTNLNIRNGVGILENGKIIFAMSKIEINFYDFAHYFQSMGCKDALYLDGLVSRTYLPSKNWVQTDGNFGVIIGVTDPSTKK